MEKDRFFAGSSSSNVGCRASEGGSEEGEERRLGDGRGGELRLAKCGDIERALIGLEDGVRNAGWGERTDGRFQVVVQQLRRVQVDIRGIEEVADEAAEVVEVGQLGESRFGRVRRAGDRGERCGTELDRRGEIVDAESGAGILHLGCIGEGGEREHRVREGDTGEVAGYDAGCFEFDLVGADGSGGNEEEQGGKGVRQRG